MLAGGRIDTLCGGQHLTSPDSTTSELVAAGSFLHKTIIPVRGQLLELGIHQDHPTPVYIDSASAIFIINDQASAKRFLWVLRRATILQEAVNMGEIIVFKIGERDNFSDPETKQLIIRTWKRHLHYTHNFPGDPPP